MFRRLPPCLCVVLGPSVQRLTLFTEERSSVLRQPGAPSRRRHQHWLPPHTWPFWTDFSLCHVLISRSSLCRFSCCLLSNFLTLLQSSLLLRLMNSKVTHCNLVARRCLVLFKNLRALFAQSHFPRQTLPLPEAFETHTCPSSCAPVQGLSNPPDSTSARRVPLGFVLLLQPAPLWGLCCEKPTGLCVVGASL